MFHDPRDAMGPYGAPDFSALGEQQFPSAIGGHPLFMGPGIPTDCYPSPHDGEETVTLDQKIEDLEREQKNLQHQAFDQKQRLQRLEQRVCLFLQRISSLEAKQACSGKY